MVEGQDFLFTGNPSPCSKKTVTMESAMAVYNRRDRKRFLPCLAKKSPGQVTFNRLQEKERAHFTRSMHKEIRTLLESGAMPIMLVEAASSGRPMPVNLSEPIIS